MSFVPFVESCFRCARHVSSAGYPTATVTGSKAASAASQSPTRAVACVQTSVASYNDKLDRLNGDDEARTSIVERLKTFDDQLEGIKAEEQEARDKLTALQQKEEKKYEDIPALKEVRDILPVRSASRQGVQSSGRKRGQSRLCLCERLLSHHLARGCPMSRPPQKCAVGCP